MNDGKLNCFIVSRRLKRGNLHILGVVTSLISWNWFGNKPISLCFITQSHYQSIPKLSRHRVYVGLLESWNQKHASFVFECPAELS